jgi:hypothetical protein
MSARPAWRLADMEFGAPHDYVGGRADWLAAGLPVQRGGGASRPTVAECARTDVPTCAPGDPCQVALDRMAAIGVSVCAVVNARGVLLGSLDPKRARAATGVVARDAMDGAPQTVRSSLVALPDWVHRDGRTLLVTRSDGTLVGLLDARRFADDRL